MSEPTDEKSKPLPKSIEPLIANKGLDLKELADKLEEVAAELSRQKNEIQNAEQSSFGDNVKMQVIRGDQRNE